LNNKSRYFIKNMGVLTISNFASKILVFLLVPLYTSVLSTTEYGTYDLVVSTVALLYPILTANIVDAVMRFSMDKSCEHKEIAAIGMKYILIGISVVVVGLLIISKFRVFKTISGMEIYIIAYFISYVLNQFFLQFAKGLEKIVDMGIAGVIGTVIMLIANIVFLLLFKWGLSGFFIANILAQAVPAIYFFFRLKFWTYLDEFHINKKLQRDMLIYCLPLIATALGWWVNNASDKYIVTFICGVAANGILSVSYKIPSIINVFQGIFTQAWQISAIKEYGDDSTAEFYGNTFLTINVMMSAACSWLIILSKPLATILYAKDFYIAWRYVPFLLISSVLNCASGLLGPILSAKKDSKSMAMSAVYGAIANIIMNILFVYTIGIQGATIATVIASFIIYAVRKKAVSKDIIINGYKVVLITWGLLCIQALLEIYTELLWVQIILMGVMLLINRYQVKNILKQMKLLCRRRG